MKSKRLYLSILLFLLQFTSFLSCVKVTPGYYAEDKKNCLKEIQLFHNRFNDKRFNEIFDKAYIGFQVSNKKDTILNHMNLSYNIFGKYEGIIDSSINVLLGAPIEVRAVFVSKFENCDVTEIFSFVKQDDSLKLYLYRANIGRVSLAKVKENINNK